jgi:phosphoenolpyruvate carboxykinase (ATP)
LRWQGKEKYQCNRLKRLEIALTLLQLINPTIMQELGIKPPDASVKDLGIEDGKAHWNLPPHQLIQHALKAGQAKLTSTGALAVDTGEFTGRSPKDKFTVKDEITADTIWWNDFNIPFHASQFDHLYTKLINYFNGKEFFVRDVYACADMRYRMNIRVINEYAWSNLFVHNMFLRPTEKELTRFAPEWHILNALVSTPILRKMEQDNIISPL